jgi:hypothetical protein
MLTLGPVKFKILKLDESCTSNSKSEVENWTRTSAVQFLISDFEFEVQDSSNFKILNFIGPSVSMHL